MCIVFSCFVRDVSCLVCIVASFLVCIIVIDLRLLLLLVLYVKL